jgi:hypothetical protein
MGRHGLEHTKMVYKHYLDVECMYIFSFYTHIWETLRSYKHAVAIRQYDCAMSSRHVEEWYMGGKVSESIIKGGKVVGEGIKTGLVATAHVVKGAGQGAGKLAGETTRGAAYTVAKSIHGTFKGWSDSNADKKCLKELQGLKIGFDKRDYAKKVTRMEKACISAPDPQCDEFNDSYNTVKSMNHQGAKGLLYGKSTPPLDLLKRTYKYGQCKPE